MSSRNHYESFDITEDLDEINQLAEIRNMPRANNGMPKKVKHKSVDPEQSTATPNLVVEVESFDFSYKASRHEGIWLVDSLGGFYDTHWIDDVLSMIKGGKEASVYLCANPESASQRGQYSAAKVYRPRMLRNLRKDHIYREGRTDLDIDGRGIDEDGMLNAMRKHSKYGLELLHTSWIGHEYKTMQILYAAGADVPVPYATANNAILMAYIGELAAPAPTLNTVDLDFREAKQLFDRVVHNIDLMLKNQRVHADLSAFNILYWEGDISLIDFPQAIDPQENRNAFSIFERDVTRVCDYFSRQGLNHNSKQLAASLWKSNGYRMHPDIHPRLLDDQDDGDMAYWQSLNNG